MLTLCGRTLIDLGRVVCVTAANEAVIDGQGERVTLAEEEANELREMHRTAVKKDRAPRRGTRRTG